MLAQTTKDRVVAIAAVIGLSGIVLVGCVDVYTQRLKAATEEAYMRGKTEGIAEAKKTVKDLILEDPNYTRVVCRLWWFGMDVKERKVK